MSEEIKPWTIKNIPPEHRNAFIAEAKRAKLDIGEWLIRAGRAYITAERGESRALVAETPPDPERFAAVIRLATEVAASAGGVMPKGLSRTLFSSLHDDAKKLKGASATASRPPRIRPSPQPTAPETPPARD